MRNPAASLTDEKKRTPPYIYIGERTAASLEQCEEISREASAARHQSSTIRPAALGAGWQAFSPRTFVAPKTPRKSRRRRRRLSLHAAFPIDFFLSPSHFSSAWGMLFRLYTVPGIATALARALPWNCSFLAKVGLDERDGSRAHSCNVNSKRSGDVAGSKLCASTIYFTTSIRRYLTLPPSRMDGVPCFVLSFH